MTASMNVPYFTHDGTVVSVQVCGHVRVQRDHHVRAGRGHLRRAGPAEELEFRPYLGLYHLLHYRHTLPCICAKGTEKPGQGCETATNLWC